MTDAPALVLASGSPRRRQLLSQMGLHFAVHPSDVDEPPFVSGSTRDYALGLATAKAEAVAARFPQAVVLGADTIVVIDGQVLGKPEDDDHARRVLTALAGKRHHVTTAVALRGASRAGLAVTTAVDFRPLTAAEIAGYVATGEGRDKAGSYGIQEIGVGLVAQIEGSYSNVVGLPVAETIDLLRQAKVLQRWP